jgi:TonB family protein
VSAPVAVYQPEPPYTEEARKAKFSGAVLLSVVVDAQGNTRDIQVVKPLGMGLDEKAVETIRTWRFRPGRRNNVPVPVSMLVEITFRLL